MQPAIRISPPPDWRPVDDALARLQDFDWLVFSSANGVRAVVERWRQLETRDGEAPAFPAWRRWGRARPTNWPVTACKPN